MLPFCLYWVINGWDIQRGTMSGIRWFYTILILSMLVWIIKESFGWAVITASFGLIAWAIFYEEPDESR